ncbi:MAG TPA: ATPase [Ramlibacter sp.]|jgi:hypothetical protein
MTLKKLKPGAANKIVFRAGTKVGYPSAEDDQELLFECFIDMGITETLLDLKSPGSVVVGRTGSGKSAALLNIGEKAENCIQIDPADLALGYISNSNVIAFFSGLGVNFDLFYRFLWRHVLCVELLNYHYNVRKKGDFERAIETFRDMIGANPAKQAALDYLRTWGGQFWEQTQERIKEIVEKFETSLTAGVDLTKIGAPLNAHASSKVDETKKTELVHHATNVVSSIQIRRLSVVMDILAENIYNDEKRRTYIIVDRLDDNWVDDKTKLKLIRALLETIKDFKKVRSVKAIVSLRTDLIERVFTYTRDPGFQEEKYDAVLVPVRWSKTRLQELIDKRITAVFRKKYTKDNVAFLDIFEENYRGNQKTADYIINRTQMRPRDLIAFVNEIFDEVAGRERITSRDIERAEIEYSKKRLRALCTEWQVEHPYLETCIEMLRRQQSRLDASSFTAQFLEPTVTKLAMLEPSPDGVVSLCLKHAYGEIDVLAVRNALLEVLYKTGAIGIRLRNGEPVHFTYDSSFVFKANDLGEDSRVSVSPMLWGALSIVRQRVKGGVLDGNTE